MKGMVSLDIDNEAGGGLGDGGDMDAGDTKES